MPEELGDDFWAAVDYCGFLHITYDPGTLRPRSIFLNAAYSQMAGLGREQMLRRQPPPSSAPRLVTESDIRGRTNEQRVGRGRAARPIPTFQCANLICAAPVARRRIRDRTLPVAAELDWLCSLIDDLAAAPDSPDTARYLRLPLPPAPGGGGGGGGAMLVSVTTRRVYDAVGRLAEVRERMDRLVPVPRLPRPRDSGSHPTLPKYNLDRSPRELAVDTALSALDSECIAVPERIRAVSISQPKGRTRMENLTSVWLGGGGQVRTFVTPADPADTPGPGSAGRESGGPVHLCVSVCLWEGERGRGRRGGRHIETSAGQDGGLSI